MTEDAAELLRKWAAILEIPGGHFVNHELRFAADELDRLRAENAELKTVIHASCTTESATENNRIRAENYVLRKYARHRSTCSLALGLYETCNCGFDAISAPPGKEA